MVQVLKQAFQYLESINNCDIVVTLGNTGCGKSTLLTSLLYGSEALVEKKIKVRIPTICGKNGEAKFKTK